MIWAALYWGRKCSHSANFAVFMLVALPGYSFAGFYVCNDTGTPIDLAVGWYEKIDEEWLSAGWFHIRPRECALGLPGLLPRHVYYYAEASGMRWQGDSRFCVSDGSFLDGQYRGCDFEYFKEKATGGNDKLEVRLTEERKGPRSAANACYREGVSEKEFAKCWTRQMATERQREILDCYDNRNSMSEFAICAAGGEISSRDTKTAACAEKYAKSRATVDFVNCMAAGRLDEDEARLVNCAISNQGKLEGMAGCALEGELSESEREQYRCITNHYNDYKRAGTCLLGTQMSEHDAEILNCVARNTDSYVAMGLCAVDEDTLTKEQRIFVQCAAASGGEPLTFVVCAGGQLTVNELEKCVNEGVGGDGCFGPNNDIVKHVTNVWRDVTEGPGPNNDLVGRDGFVMKTMRRVEREITGHDGAVRKAGRDFERTVLRPLTH